MRSLARLYAASALGLALGCRHPEPSPPPHAVLPLHVTPLADLAPAATLRWLLDARPRSLALDGRIASPLARVLPPDRLAAFARVWGGVDLRETDELVLASYPTADLWLARQFVDPRRVEAAFRARVISVEGRVVEGHPDDARTTILRLWGPTASEREQVAVLGVEAVALERGRFGPLKAAEAFALSRLKRASPALKAEPLARVAALLGDAPLRAFAPGPFEGDSREGAGGLLAGTVAVGARARIDDGPGLGVRIVLLGAWGGDPAAAERLQAVFDITRASGPGRLLGLDHLLAGPTVRNTDEALLLDFTMDPARLAEGLYAATSADVWEIMQPTPR